MHPFRLDYEIGLAGLHSDNILQTESNELSETVLAPSLRFEATQESSDLQVRARGDFQYLDYRSDRFDDELVGNFAGRVNWFVVPDYLALFASDYLGRSPVNILGGFTPGNQQEVNVLTAGPSLYLRPGSRTRIQLDTRVSDARASETKEFNNKRYGAALRTLHALAPDRTLSSNFEYAKVEFEGAGPDYRRYDAFAGYLQELRNEGELSLALGYTRISRAGVGSDGAPLARVALGWQVAPRHRVDVRARYEYADAASDLVMRNDRFDEPIIEDLSSPNVVIGPNLFRLRRFEGGYQYEGERFSAYVRPFMERVTYEEPDNTHWDSRGAYADLNYQFNPRLALSLQAQRDKRDVMGAREDRDDVVRVSLEYQFSRRLSGWIGGQRRDRESSTPGASFRDNQVMAGLVFRR